MSAGLDAGAGGLLSRRCGDRLPAAPIAAVHLGLGNFFRSHQAWYTENAPDAGGWGICAFTGRSAGLADRLTAQDGLYTLVTRAATGNRYDVIGSITEAHGGGDGQSWRRAIGALATRVLTLTVTEAAYRRGSDGDLDRADPAVSSDIVALHHDPASLVTTVPAKLVAGLAARRCSGAGPITVIPCDNLPNNGAAVRTVVLSTAELVDPGLAEWIAEHVSFVTTVVDRITPRSTDRDVAEVLSATGRADLCPVITEPFSEWVLSGQFPAGRPQWEDAGAQIVDDIAPFERRKLWLLNGAHSLLAYVASIKGHRTVAQAMADDECREWVGRWWAEARAHLDLPGRSLTDYTDALARRFDNPAMQHLLAQIAADGSQKLPVRVLPVLRLERAAGRVPLAATRILAAWILHLRGRGARLTDVGSAAVVPLASGPLPAAVVAVLDYLDPDIGADSAVVAAVLAHVHELAKVATVTAP